MKYFSILLAFTLAGNVNAQVFSQAQFLSSTPFELKGALLIDLDGDGDLDALAGGVGFNDSGIETWVNNNGQFELVNGNIPFSQFGGGVFAAADVDSDGDMDFATVIESTLVVFRNNGTGQFASPSILESDAGDVRSIAFGQLDAVLGPEMVITRIDSEDVLLYANDGAGNYGPAITVTTESVDPIDALIGDFNGDGLNDISVACLNSCDVTWHENFGSLSFGPQVSLGMDQIGTYKLALGDFDENGHLDIASVGFGSDDLSVFYNNGGGSFQPRTVISTNVDGATNLATGDFNDDGNLDLCVGAENINLPTLFLGDGSGNFLEILLEDNGSVSNPEAYLAGDVDGDGLLDLVTASQNDNKLAWFKQKPELVSDLENPFEDQQVINKPASRVNDLVAADLDGDGKDDLLTTEGSSGRVAWYKNNLPEAFGEHEVLLDLNEGLAGLDAGDIDGDGTMDIVVSNVQDSSVVLYYNQGGGTSFSEAIIDQGLDGPYGPVLADLDNDGDLDILQSSGWDETVYIYPNLGAGTFGGRITLCNDCLFSTAIAAKDLNGDNLPEVLVYVGQNQEVVIYENLGNLTFGIPELIIDNINGCRDIQFSDFDNDGDLDVFASGIFVNRIKYAENLGNLNFAAETEVPFLVQSVYSIQFLDVDQDGQEDIAYTDFFSNRILYIRIENGNFVERKAIDNNAYQNPSSLLAADFAGDGIPDIVSGYWNYVAFYENLASPCVSLIPENLEVSFQNNMVTFSWDPIPDTEGCRITVQNQQGMVNGRNIIGQDVSGFSAPQGALTGGPDFSWRVVCACSLFPLELTSNSSVGFFSFPQGLVLFPNPAQESLSVQFESGFDPSGTNFRITDLQGRTVREGIYSSHINLSELDMGYYLIEIDGKVSRFLKD